MNKFICILASTTAYVAVNMLVLGFVKVSFLFIFLFIFAVSEYKQKEQIVKM